MHDALRALWSGPALVGGMVCALVASMLLACVGAWAAHGARCAWARARAWRAVRVRGRA